MHVSTSHRHDSCDSDDRLGYQKRKTRKQWVKIGQNAPQESMPSTLATAGQVAVMVFSRKFTPSNCQTAAATVLYKRAIQTSCEPE